MAAPVTDQIMTVIPGRMLLVAMPSAYSFGLVGSFGAVDYAFE